jgi:cytochrome c
MMFSPRFALLLSAILLQTTTAFAQDAAAGETTFKKCKACHAIVAPDGTEIQKGGKTGPNLYGVIGRQIGSEPDFVEKYGPSLLLAGADGAVWDEASLAAYLVDPTAWLKEKTADPAAKSKMAFKLAKGNEDVAAYLASFAPAAPAP